MIDFCKWRSVADQTARVDELAPVVYCGHCVAGCKRRELSTLSGKISIAADVKGVSPSLDEVREGHVNVAFGAGIQDVNLRLDSASSRLALLISNAASGLLGFTSAAIVVAFGTRSRSNSNRFGPNSVAISTTPVALPSGRLRLLTRPNATGSPPPAKTIGMVAVAALAACAVTEPPTATRTAT